jgi:ribosomal protein S18 acetylase RimI-like enzyme
MKTGIRTHGGASLRVRYSQAVESSLRGLIRELTDVKTDPKHRGKGHASKLLDEVCAEASKEHVALMVKVKPFGKSKMDAQKLMFWYARKGFELIQSEPSILMVRA